MKLAKLSFSLAVTFLCANCLSVSAVDNNVLNNQRENVERIMGDVNADGVLSVADAVLLQKWLLVVPEIEIADWESADFNKDGKLDVFDFCLMKQELIRTSPNSLKPEETKFTIVPAESKTVEYEKYDNGMISMEIPKGWEVNILSQQSDYIGYRFDVINPEDDRYYLFSSICLDFWSGNEQVQEFCKQYGIPVINLNPLTVENFFRICYEDLQGLNFEAIENLGMTPAGDSGTVHAIVRNDSGKSCEGLFSVDLDNLGGGSEMLGIYLPDWVVAYGMTAVTAPEGELVNWVEPLIHCLSTVTYSDAFMKGYNAEWQQIFNNSAIIAQTGSEISNIITSGYEERQSTYDIISQKQSDATLGYERVYDTETGEIYKAYLGFTDDISNDSSLSERYKPITDDMYLNSIDGYIEK